MFKHLDKKIVKEIIFFTVFAAFLVAALIAIRERYVRPRAEAGKPHLSFGFVKEGDNLAVTVRVNPNGTQFAAFDIFFDYDQAKLQLIDGGNGWVERLFTSDLPLVTDKNGNVLRVGGTKTNENFSGTQNIDLFKVKFKLLATSGSVSFNWNSAKIKVSDKQVTLSQGTDNTYTITQAGGDAKIYFKAEKETPYHKNENLNLSLYLDTNNSSAKSLQFIFSYDPNILTFQVLGGSSLANDNIVFPSTLAGDGFDTSMNVRTIDETSHKVTVGLRADSPVKKNNIQLATVKFKIKSGITVPATLTFSPDADTIVYDGTGNDIIGSKPALNIGIEQDSPVNSPTPTTTTSPQATATPTVTTTPRPTNSPTPTITGTPVPTRTPTPTPIPSVTPTPSATPIPTPPSGRDNYTINIGDKDSLTINITGGEEKVPYIKFGVTLFGVENTPDIKVKLRVGDMVVKLTPAPNGGSDICNNPGWGEKLYSGIQMRADSSGVYRPIPESVFIYSGKEYHVSSDGWVPLIDISGGSTYSFAVKGPKHRNVLMTSTATLSTTDPKPASQNYDWSGNALEPGDLPDSGNQDCVANTHDMSLIINRIRSTDGVDLGIADVDYNDIINAADISKVDHTLSTKPDDD